MRYWKRIDTHGNITTVESYSHNLEVKGAIEVTKRQYNEYIASLPIIEPEPPHSTHISVIDAIDATKPRPVRVKRIWQDTDYFYDCLVTEAVKDQYIQGDIAVADYVIVFFDGVGEQIVTAKIFKSW